jgi:uncharacterized protein (UPF0276 family)
MTLLDSIHGNLFPQMGLGLGLRSDHYSDVLGGRSSVSWFEVVSENFLVDGGRPLHILNQVRKDYDLALHGVSLSIGSVDPIDRAYLKRLKDLVTRFEPALVSDHCCWTGIEGENLHDLMPLPFTEEVVHHVVDRVKQVQDFLGKRILLENVSSYLTFSHSDMTEWEFLSEIAERSDCGLLLDVNNIYVSSVNHGFDPLLFISQVPPRRVGQIHLAGHSVRKTPEGRTYLIDTHDHPVCDEVWSLYKVAVGRFGAVNTMIERDARIPTYSELEAELFKAEEIQRTILGESHEDKRASRNAKGISTGNQKSAFESASSNFV